MEILLPALREGIGQTLGNSFRRSIDDMVGSDSNADSIGVRYYTDTQGTFSSLWWGSSPSYLRKH